MGPLLCGRIGHAGLMEAGFELPDQILSRRVMPARRRREELAVFFAATFAFRISDNAGRGHGVPREVKH